MAVAGAAVVAAGVVGAPVAGPAVKLELAVVADGTVVAIPGAVVVDAGARVALKVLVAGTVVPVGVFFVICHATTPAIEARTTKMMTTTMMNGALDFVGAVDIS